MPRSASLIRPASRGRRLCYRGNAGQQQLQTNTGTSHALPSPCHSPWILNEGFRHIRVFPQPSGGALRNTKGPTMTNPAGRKAEGFRAALIGGLHRVTATGPLPDSTAPSHLPLSLDQVYTSFLCIFHDLTAGNEKKKIKKILDSPDQVWGVYDFFPPLLYQYWWKCYTIRL